MGGTLLVSANADAGITIIGTLSGVEESATGGIHIHSGYSCASTDGPGGHYFDGLDTDPWTTTYASSSDGSAEVSLSLADFTMTETRAVAFRTVVVHSSSGSRTGCGVIDV